MFSGVRVALLIADRPPTRVSERQQRVQRKGVSACARQCLRSPMCRPSLRGCGVSNSDWASRVHSAIMCRALQRMPFRSGCGGCSRTSVPRHGWNHSAAAMSRQVGMLQPCRACKRYASTTAFAESASGDMKQSYMQSSRLFTASRPTTEVPAASSWSLSASASMSRDSISMASIDAALLRIKVRMVLFLSQGRGSRQQALACPSIACHACHLVCAALHHLRRELVQS